MVVGIKRYIEIKHFPWLCNLWSFYHHQEEIEPNRDSWLGWTKVRSSDDFLRAEFKAHIFLKSSALALQLLVAGGREGAGTYLKNRIRPEPATAHMTGPRSRQVFVSLDGS